MTYLLSGAQIVPPLPRHSVRRPISAGRKSRRSTYDPRAGADTRKIFERFLKVRTGKRWWPFRKYNSRSFKEKNNNLPFYLSINRTRLKFIKIWWIFFFLSIHACIIRIIIIEPFEQSESIRNYCTGLGQFADRTRERGVTWLPPLE